MTLNTHLFKKIALSAVGLFAVGFVAEQPAYANTIESSLRSRPEVMNPPRYPGRPGPVRPGPRPRPVRPAPPPVRPEPPRPYPPPERPPIHDPGYVDEQKSIYLGRRFYNETLHLREMLGLGPQYRGYIVDSVIVDIRGASYNTNLYLMVNGRVADTAYSPDYSVVLYPQFEDELGDEVRSLQLRIEGVLDIDSITVNLRRSDRYDRDPGAGRDIVVPIVLYQRLMGNDRLDLGQYVNLWNYHGYRLIGLELNARAVYGNASIEVLVNGFNLFNPIWLTQFSQNHMMFPNREIIIGQGAESIVIYSRGDIELNHVNLRLSRH